MRTLTATLTRMCVWLGLLAAVLAATNSSAEDAMTKEQTSESRFVLEITGTEGVAFSGECRLRSAGGEETIAIEGPSPLRRELTGTRLSCRITQESADGMLTVELRKETGSVSRSRTRGFGSSIQLSIQ